ncbi:MAG: hypothetical protein GF308_06075 [Candidatus Heimdallarchaeota archaeon]|nr:hypothetical protein [Candidatus Heimdallarchaeota archaeon]
MKPVGLALIQMGKTGLELVKSHPNVLPKETLNEIVLKSMPLSAKDGDYASSTAGGCVFESYIFSIPGKRRRNIASLVVIFDKENYDRKTIRRFCSFTITELKKNNLADAETISEILPNLYNGLSERRMKIKISSVVTLSFDFDEKEQKDKKPEEKFVDSLKEDFWK